MTNGTRTKRANQWLAIFWASHIPVAVGAYFLLPRETFVALSLLYTVIVSQFNLVGTHWGAAIAARVNEKQDE